MVVKQPLETTDLIKGVDIKATVKGGGNLMNQLNVNDFNLPMMNNVELFSGDGNNNDIPNNEKEVSMVWLHQKLQIMQHVRDLLCPC